jgi:RNA polymerase sigma-70 factor (ECF subfamily)
VPDTKAVVSLSDVAPLGRSVDAERRARLEALFAAHANAVFAYARRRGSLAEAEEVVSETFLVAWRRVDGIPEPALPWLLGVARKALANRRRGDARQAAVRVRLAVVTPADAESPATEATAPTGDVLRALASLSPAEREAITLVAWDGLTPAEAATVLGCSRAAIYVRLHRARSRVARHLDPEETSA